MRKNVVFLNVISSVILQFFTIIYGFIIPKLIIIYFGSKVNGLVSSISQLLSYITLVEGGITAVIISKLYLPLSRNNFDEVSSIIITGKNFFRKIGMIFVIYSFLLALICPFVYMKDGFSYSFIFSLTLILSIGLLIQYMLSLSFKCLLTADKKVYYISFAQILIIIISLIFSYISVVIFPSIHIFKFLSGITYIIQPIMYGFFVKKNYHLNMNSQINDKLIQDRWNGFANNFAYFIHTSTDVTVLTFASSLVIVSVYSVYTLVTSGLKSIIGAFNNGVFPSIGHLYADGNLYKLEKKFDLYEFVYLIIVFFIFTIASMMITPFILLYVGDSSVNNIYYQPIFGYLISFALLLDLAKAPHVNLSYAANKFKEISIPCFIEALINIIVSIILVFLFGIIGVAVGTILAMLYRIIFQVYLTKKIINRKQIKFYKTFISLLIVSIVSIFICNYLFPINIAIINIKAWILYSILYSAITFVIYLLTIVLFFKNHLIYFLAYLKK